MYEVLFRWNTRNYYRRGHFMRPVIFHSPCLFKIQPFYMFVCVAYNVLVVRFRVYWRVGPTETMGDKSRLWPSSIRTTHGRTSKRVCRLHSMSLNAGLGQITELDTVMSLPVTGVPMLWWRVVFHYNVVNHVVSRKVGVSKNTYNLSRVQVVIDTVLHILPCQ